jgi:hypothetical protein
VPADVASRGDGRPVDFGVPICQLVGKPPSPLRDNLRSANNGVNRLSVHAKSREGELGDESLDRVNIVDDVTQTKKPTVGYATSQDSPSPPAVPRRAGLNPRQTLASPPTSGDAANLAANERR